MATQQVVKIPATETTREYLYFGLSGMEAADLAAKGYEVRAAAYLRQPWEEMQIPRALISYGKFNLLSY